MRSRFVRPVALALLGLLFAACSGGTSQPGLDACTGPGCGTDACVAGGVGCACLPDSTCTSGECVLGACIDCQRGQSGCVCLNNGTCDPGQRCGDDGLCAACTDGVKTCPCRTDRTCDGDLECQDGTCLVPPCPKGTDGCPCGDTDPRCGDTLYCTGGALCAKCTNDVEGCPCLDGACEGGLVCEEAADTCRKAKTCVQVACVAHQSCRADDGVDALCLAACEGGWTWDAGSGACLVTPVANCQAGRAGSIRADCDAQHRQCVEDAGGAHCDTCLPFFLAAAADCRAARTCLDLGCDAAHRACAVETATSDATCGDCLPGYLVDGDACLTPPAHCTAGLPGSIVEACAVLNRGCVTPREGGVAECGACLDGFAEDGTGVCLVLHTCDELGCHDLGRQCVGVVPFQSCGACDTGLAASAENPDACVQPLSCQDLACPSDRFCQDGAAGQDAQCVPALCSAGKAWRADQQKCIDCFASCNAGDPGETGRTWPFTLFQNDTCICETLAGWYWDDGERAAKPCDSDGDGWVRTPARTYLESADETLRQNARCQLRRIDRFTLQNEYAQRLDLYLCQGIPALRREDQGYCATFAPLPLYETVRNDDQAELGLDPLLPSYAAGGNGRKPRAAELNGLTRLCTAGGDANQNGVSDLSEWHGMPPGGMTADQAILSRFGFYLELDRGWYEAGAGQPYGRYVIAERSRCDLAGFPLRYADTDGSYWRQCTRSRDTAYDATDGPVTPDFGMEFAQWSCPAAFGGCNIPPPPTAAIPDGAQAPARGLCEVDLPPPANECEEEDPFPCLHGQMWRGMSHHSQFRCVALNAQSSVAEPRVAPLDVYGGQYRWNRCHVACPEGDPTCAADCAAGLCATSSTRPAVGFANPADPRLVCETVDTPAAGEVGWVLASFAGGPPYTRGCIDEWTPDTIHGNLNGSDDPVVSAWRDLCPGWVRQPDSATGEGDADDFGRLQCGCGDHYGGSTCEVGCPTNGLHVDPSYDAVQRQGYWMCAWPRVAGFEANLPGAGPALAGTDADGGSWVMRGNVPLTPTDGQPLCQDPEGCLSGFVLVAE